MKLPFGLKPAYIIAFLVICGAAGFTMWAFSSSMTPYTDIAGARKSEVPVQVRGRILHETAYYDTHVNALRFVIEDRNKQRIEVIYRGAKPESFDTAPETAAHGVVQNGMFQSDSLVVKCPSKYDDKKSPYKRADAEGGRS